MTLRRDLEDAVVAAVAARLTYLKAVHPYAGELGGAKDLSEIKERLKGRVPGVLVSCRGSAVDTLIQSRHVVKDEELDLYLVSGNMRSREDKLRADAGIYQIAQDLERLLLGRDVGIAGVGRLNLRSESQEIHAPDLAVWRVRYEVRMDAVADDDPTPTLLQIAGKLYQSLDEDPAGTAPPVALATEDLPP